MEHGDEYPVVFRGSDIVLKLQEDLDIASNADDLRSPDEGEGDGVRRDLGN